MIAGLETITSGDFGAYADGKSAGNDGAPQSSVLLRCSIPSGIYLDAA